VKSAASDEQSAGLMRLFGLEDEIIALREAPTRLTPQDRVERGAPLMADTRREPGLAPARCAQLPGRLVQLRVQGDDTPRLPVALGADGPDRHDDVLVVEDDPAFREIAQSALLPFTERITDAGSELLPHAFADAARLVGRKP
jgi:hypothetical protein